MVFGYSLIRIIKFGYFMKEGTDKILNSKSKTFLAFCFCFILGVGLFSSLELAEYWLFRLYILLFIISFY